MATMHISEKATQLSNGSHFSGLHRMDRSQKGRPTDLPREKLIFRGLDALNDTELLALLLGSGMKGSTVLEIAGRLLKRFGQKGLSQLKFEDLKQQKGIGTAKASSVLAAVELGRRLFDKPSRCNPTIDGPESAFLLSRDLAQYKKEHFVSFYLNAKNQILKRETVSIGSLFANVVHPREVFAPALELSAAAIIVAHNHPSGDPEPSPEDRSLTARLVEAGKLLGIEMLDHLVIGHETYVSFQARGWI